MRTPDELPLPRTTWLCVSVGAFYYDFRTVPVNFCANDWACTQASPTKLVVVRAAVSVDDFTVHSCTHKPGCQ